MQLNTGLLISNMVRTGQTKGSYTMTNSLLEILELLDAAIECQFPSGCLDLVDDMGFASGM
jgi:hypothetical protein